MRRDRLEADWRIRPSVLHVARPQHAVAGCHRGNPKEGRAIGKPATCMKVQQPWARRTVVRKVAVVSNRTRSGRVKPCDPRSSESPERGALLSRWCEAAGQQQRSQPGRCDVSTECLAHLSKATAGEILIDPVVPPRAVKDESRRPIEQCVQKSRSARARGASVMLI